MQTISSILKIDRGLGSWVTDDGYTTDSPSFLLGVQAVLKIDLRAPSADANAEGSLPSYPASELASLAYILAMDLDYSQETACKFVKNSGITIAANEAGRLICTIPLPDTNTTAMRNALSTAASLTFNCELIARNSSDEDVFAVQFPVVVRNRVLLGTATASPDTTAPSWIPTVTAIIEDVVSDNAETLRGEDGDDGEDGKSAYEVWKDQAGNANGTVAEFLASLKGEQGATGATGPAGSLSIGSVTTLAAGSSATASIVNGALNLGIPAGAKGDNGNGLCFAFSATSDTTPAAWHAHCLSTDLYWRFSEDNGVTWTSARPLQAPAISPVARFSSVPQTTNPVWTSLTQGTEYSQAASEAAYFRVRMEGYPWTEPRLINAPSGIDSMTASEIAAQETILKATTIRAQFSSDNTSWHASIQAGDLYIKFFSTTGTVLATWNLSSFGSAHALAGLQTSPSGPQWHDNPQAGDRYMKISLDGGQTWYSNCFVIAADQVSGGSSAATANLTMGTVTTLPAGSQATASIVDGVLNLGIPRGADGEDGEDGVDGSGGGSSLGSSAALALASSASAGSANTAARSDHVHPTTGLATSADLQAVQTALAGKQATLVSGTTLKTINSQSLLGSGNINLATTSSEDADASTDGVMLARSVSEINEIAALCDANPNKFISFVSLATDALGANDFGKSIHGGDIYAACKIDQESSFTWEFLRWTGGCPYCWQMLNAKYMVYYERTGFKVRYHQVSEMGDGETYVTDADVIFQFSLSNRSSGVMPLFERAHLVPRIEDLENGVYSGSGGGINLRLTKTDSGVTWAYENIYTGATYGSSSEIAECISSFDYVCDEEEFVEWPDLSIYDYVQVERNTISQHIVEYIVIDLVDMWKSSGTNVRALTASSGNASVRPGGNYSLALDADTTLAAPGGKSGQNLSSLIDIAPGSHTLTAGTGLALADSLTANKINHCVVRWWGTSASLHVLHVEDATSSGGGSGGSSTTAGNGYWTVASSGITGCDGTYNPTGDTVTTSSGTFPVYSNGTYFIFACENMAGTPTPYLWCLHTSIQTDGMSCTAYKSQSTEIWSGMAMSIPQPVFHPDYTGMTGAYLDVTTADSTKSGRYYLHSGTAGSPSAVWKNDNPIRPWYIFGEQGTYCYWYIKNAATSAASSTSLAIYGSSWSYDPDDGADAIFASGVTYGSTTTTYRAS